MSPIRKILVPIDFSDASEEALVRAVALASVVGATVTALHVYELALFGPNTLAPTPAPGLEQKARDSLRALVARHRIPGVEIQGVIREGAAWSEILEEVSATHADLIVMGTHGRTGIARALLGSVAEKVLRHAAVPVMTVHETALPRSATAASR